jgi:hypothetical protein
MSATIPNTSLLSVTTVSENYVIASSVLGATSTDPRNINIIANADLTPSQIVPLNIGALTNMDLYITSPTTGISLELYDEFGNVLTPVAFTPTSTASFFYRLLAGTIYNLAMIFSAEQPSTTTLMTLTSQIIPATSDYFSNGITNTLTSGNVTFTTDAYGTATWTFNNYPVVASTPGVTSTYLKVGEASVAISSGALNIKSSNTSVFVGYTQGFYPRNSCVFDIQVLVTTTFTGTITIGVVGAGVSTSSNLIATQTQPPIVTLSRKIMSEKRLLMRTSTSNMDMDEPINSSNKIMRVN